MQTQDNTPALRDASQHAQPIERYCGPRTWAELIKQAETLFGSGLLPRSVRTPEAAIAIIQTGRELQLNPMEAFRAIHVIEGTPTVSPRCKLGLILRSGLLEDMRLEEGDGFAEVTMRRKGHASPISARFTMEEARAAGLVGKTNWKSWPKNMLRWRAIGFAADLLFSDVTGGHFTPDEMGAETDADGAAIEQAPAPPARAIDPEHMRRVNEAWQEAIASGWDATRIGRFLREHGAAKKSEVTEEILRRLHEAIDGDRQQAEPEDNNAPIVIDADWTNDPILRELQG